MSALTLPLPIQARVEAMAAGFLQAQGMPPADFATPVGEPALVAADAVSWRVFKNPVGLFIGGVAAVILELAEPRVRAGVWDHTTFRTDPVARLRRTGLAAMVTVYAARSRAEAMIAAVGRRHAKITGLADDGRAYAASDPALLDWVQATASYGFAEAYHRFVRPLSAADRDRAWAESAPAARLYGAVGAPRSQVDWAAQLAAMRSALTASPVVAEFLQIMRQAPALPGLARPLQPLLVRAAVDLIPPDVARGLALWREPGLSPAQAALVRAAARAADRLCLRNAPPAQACVRLGLPADWLYR
ncbi:oxygenase MpaB family protein [Caulobacter sp. KR2-114]|uniref:oxygenase MpaB family protein n=1 Tax=Caulobacter sp. KR2-114 TaxID=3400912 RepID=UPI003C102E9B